MSIEGVMVSYNYSEDEEHANIITVASSGIRFSNRWVLTHGSILSPLKQANVIKQAKGRKISNDEFYYKLPEVYVTCEKKDGTVKNVYESVEKLSRDRSSGDAELEHNSYQVRVLTGRICHVWQCPALERCVSDVMYAWTIGHRHGDLGDQSQIGKTLLSVFVLIDLESDHRDVKTIRPLSELYDMVRPAPGRGATVEIHSTPFGCEVFLNAITRGSVCGVMGKRPLFLLTDAVTALGSEGGPVFNDGPTKELSGMVAASVSWCRGEWVGLTLIAPLVTVLATKLRVGAVVPPAPLHPHQHILERIDSTTVLVRCGAAWGTGVYLGSGFVLTCSHVVQNYSTYKVSIYCQGVQETGIVRYKTVDGRAYDLAIVYTNPHNWRHLNPAVFADDPAEKGESVLAAGYPYFNENDLTDLRPTVTTGHISNVSPSMLQTSCCVQSGFSGGPIFRLTSKNHLVEVLSIVVCNSKTETGASYPYINMAVPVKAFQFMLQHYLTDRDASKLKEIENKKEMIQSQWRLLPYRSKI